MLTLLAVIIGGCAMGLIGCVIADAVESHQTLSQMWDEGERERAKSRQWQ
jgi:hypothetical protein